MLLKTKIIIVFLTVFLAFLLGISVYSIICGPMEGEFQGTFTYAFEGMDFQPENSSEHWWLEGGYTFDETIRQDCIKNKIDLNKEVPLYRLKISGKLSSVGKHGHLGMWRRELAVERVLEYEYIKKKPAF